MHNQKSRQELKKLYKVNYLKKIHKNENKIIIQSNKNYREKIIKDTKQLVSKKLKQKTCQEIRIPDWFDLKSNNIDVSIIIPLYKSSKAIKSQIEKWSMFDDGLIKEIIYVDDKCPTQSYKQVLSSWTNQKKPDVGIGKIINNNQNYGYPKACNIGAKNAKGKYLVFLNADCIVYDNWLLPMIQLLHDNSIGIVGNMQFKNNKIESAGSEWCWEKNSFVHIGKNIYKGELINDQILLQNAPEDLLQEQEREMVTGCCFAIRNDLFYDLGGFDENYKIGYWEDADLCLRTRELGYKIYYQPKSKIYHDVSHSNSCFHPYKNKNYDFFYNRWISTGRIDNLVKNKRINPPKCSIKNNIDGKVVGCVIACNEEEFLEASVNSISSVVDEWIFVIGGNEYAYNAKMCNSLGYPNDKTLEIANKLVKKYGGIVIEPPGRLWKDKVEMRNEYAKRLNPGDWMFMLDGDEVYKSNQLWRITELMKYYECLILQFWTFWNNVNTIGNGKWDNFNQERLIKWKDGYQYYGTNHLFVSNKDGKLVKDCVNTYKGNERLFYHYSWVRPLEKIIQKREYYKIQAKRFQDNYIEDIYLRWRESPEQIQYTHPFGEGSWETFKGIHPKEVQELINKGLLNF